MRSYDRVDSTFRGKFNGESIIERNLHTKMEREACGYRVHMELLHTYSGRQVENDCA